MKSDNMGKAIKAWVRSVIHIVFVLAVGVLLILVARLVYDEWIHYRMNQQKPYQFSTFKKEMDYAEGLNLKLGLYAYWTKAAYRLDDHRLFIYYQDIVSRFPQELAATPDLQIRILLTLSGYYRIYNKDVVKSQSYFEQAERALARSADKITPLQYDRLKSTLIETKAERFLTKKQYHEAIGEYLRIPAETRYTDSEFYTGVENNNWGKAFANIAYIYQTKLNDSEKAEKYYRMMAIDVQQVPSEKIGYINASREVPLSVIANENYRGMLWYVSTMYDNRDWKKYQQYLVERLLFEEHEKGSISVVNTAYELLKINYKKHGIIVPYKPHILTSFIPTNNLQIIGYRRDEDGKLRLHTDLYPWGQTPEQMAAIIKQYEGLKKDW